MSDFVVEQVPAEQEELVDTLGQHVILLEDCVAIMMGDNTSQIEKRISFEDFYSIIGAVINRRNEEKIDGFQLPSNCFYFAKSATEIHLSCYYAERIADMRHFETKHTVKTPNFIISHTLQKQSTGAWRVTMSYFFCTDAKVSALPKGHIRRVDTRNRVFLSPFPNTYAEGNMCYGGNSMPSNFVDNNLTGLNWYYQFLFESPFNNDLGLRGVSDSSSVEGWFKDLAEVAKDNKPFPYNRLSGFTPNA